MTAKEKWIVEKCLRLVQSAKATYQKSRTEKDDMQSIRTSCQADMDIDDATAGLKALLGWD